MDSVPSTGRLTGAQREELIEQVKQQVAIATAQELLTVTILLFKNIRSELTKSILTRKFPRNALRSASPSQALLLIALNRFANFPTIYVWMSECRLSKDV